MNQLDAQYQQLLRVLQALNTSGLCPLEKNERAFQMAYISWQSAEQLFQTKCFNHKERMYWNRHIRSGFIAELEYILLLHHVLLFEPPPYSLESVQFWTRETERLELFILQHSAFYFYIQSGHSDKDRNWFLQSTVSYFPGSQSRHQEKGDVLLGQLHALQRYTVFTITKIHNLPPSGDIFKSMV